MLLIYSNRLWLPLLTSELQVFDSEILNPPGIWIFIHSYFLSCNRGNTLTHLLFSVSLKTPTHFLSICIFYILLGRDKANRSRKSKNEATELGWMELSIDAILASFLLEHDRIYRLKKVIHSHKFSVDQKKCISAFKLMLILYLNKMRLTFLLTPDFKPFSQAEGQIT